jgi:hypothetical protein
MATNGEIAAPIRCFFRDIPSVIGPLAKRRRIDNDSASFHQGSTQYLRLFGTVLNIQTNSENSNIPQLQTIHEYTVALTLDDGTSTALIHATPSMVQQIRLQLGMLLDCIVRVEFDNDMSETFRLTADQLALPDAEMETLRWFELNFDKSSAKMNDPLLHRKWGYPAREISSEDIYRIIACECETFPDEVPRKANGVTAKDLATCWDLSISRVETMLQELQQSGQIYQNADGLYTLL